MLKKLSFLLAILCLIHLPARSAEEQVQLITHTSRTAPYVSISLFVKAGAIDENASNAGWRHVLANAMMRGTRRGKDTLDNRALRRAAEAAGGSITAQVMEDAIVFTVAGDSARQEDLANLLLDVVLQPRLSEEDLAGARRVLLRRLGNASRDASPDTAAATLALQSQLYRNAAGALTYGLPPNGTVDSITGLVDESARKLHQLFFTAPNIMISCSGDVDEAALRAIFSRIPGGDIPAKPPVSYIAPPKVNVIKTSVDEPWLFLGYRIDSHISNAELAALRVLGAALADTSPSILSKVLLTPHDNKDHSLATSLSSLLMIRQHGSEFFLAVQSDGDHLSASNNLVYAAANKAIKELAAKPLTDAHLKKAIAYAEGDWAAAIDSNVSRSIVRGYAFVQNVDADKWPGLLKSVTAADVQNVAQKYLNNSSMVIALPETSAAPPAG